jgi:hypothetical protein
VANLSVPRDFPGVRPYMNIRVADIQACYELWRSRGTEFITTLKDKYGETRCYIRDPDGYLIEVGQSNADFTYGQSARHMKASVYQDWSVNEQRTNRTKEL